MYLTEMIDDKNQVPVVTNRNLDKICPLHFTRKEEMTWKDRVSSVALVFLPQYLGDRKCNTRLAESEGRS